MVDKIIDENTITLKFPRDFPSGKIAAFDVDADIYMRDYAADFYEWVDGVLIKMSPVSGKHDILTRYFARLLEAYFALKKIGTIRVAPFVMRMDKVKSRREPDLQVILNSNPGTLNDTYMDGAADICIEIVSPSNEGTDYGDKLREYEQGGVQEYWLIDPLRKECRFHRLADGKTYKLIHPENGTYTTSFLPQFELHIPTLWQDELPDILTVVERVKAMVE